MRRTIPLFIHDTAAICQNTTVLYGVNFALTKIHSFIYVCNIFNLNDGL
jgi:hypothetical protein